MKRFTYYLLYGLVYALSLLPFWLLYLISDALFLLVYHIVRYRRKIVWKNLSASFPDKSHAELKTIERQFYHWFCDYIFETFKLLSISDKKLLRHVEYRNVEEVEKFFDEGRNCSAISGHYCNWEWFCGLPPVIKRHPEAAIGFIYHPLYNKAVDRLFIDIRSAHGGVCVPKKDILRRLVTYKKEGLCSLIGYVSDQAPKWENMHLWVDFLHHDTPVFTGGERIMRKMNDAVFFVDIKRPRRGRYVFTFKLITAEAAKEEEFVITRRFFQMLEENICHAPAYYLWTHNRWKRGREEFNRKYDVIDGKIIRKEEYK
jgi:KDO2-lipid IV(A) lauroyltransferase